MAKFKTGEIVFAKPGSNLHCELKRITNDNTTRLMKKENRPWVVTSHPNFEDQYKKVLIAPQSSLNDGVIKNFIVYLEGGGYLRRALHTEVRCVDTNDLCVDPKGRVLDSDTINRWWDAYIQVFRNGELSLSENLYGKIGKSVQINKEDSAVTTAVTTDDVKEEITTPEITEDQGSILELPKKKRKRHSVDRQLIYEALDKGLSMKEIMETFGVSKDTYYHRKMEYVKLNKLKEEAKKQKEETTIKTEEQPMSIVEPPKQEKEIKKPYIPRYIKKSPPAGYRQQKMVYPALVGVPKEMRTPIKEAFSLLYEFKYRPIIDWRRKHNHDDPKTLDEQIDAAFELLKSYGVIRP